MCYKNRRLISMTGLTVIVQEQHMKLTYIEY